MGKKYEHLERLREKIASRASNKKVSSALASLWLEFGNCLSQFKPSCRENDEVIKKLKSIQAKIRETINAEETTDV